jgi:hypothetical protein
MEPRLDVPTSVMEDWAADMANGDGVRDSCRDGVTLDLPRGVGAFSSISPSMRSSEGAHRGSPAALRVGEGSGVRQPRLRPGTFLSASKKTARDANAIARSNTI